MIKPIFTMYLILLFIFNVSQTNAVDINTSESSVSDINCIQSESQKNSKKSYIDFLNNFSPIILSAIIAVITGSWAVYQHRRQTVLFKTNMYYDFQERFREFQKTLPSNFNNKDNSGEFKHNLHDSELRRKVEIYWHIVFDEWYLCCWINKSMKNLWKEYYRMGVIHALTIDIFVISLKDFLEHNDELLGRKSHFIKELNSLCKKSPKLENNIAELFSKYEESDILFSHKRSYKINKHSKKQNNC